MKDPARIVQYIDQCIEHFLDAPQFYALSAVQLECQLRDLDCLRQFILEDELDEEAINVQSTYHEFLRRRGYGVGLITPDRPMKAWDARNDPKLAKLRKEWAKYLANRQKYATPLSRGPFYFPIDLAELVHVQTEDGLRLDGVQAMNRAQPDHSLGVDSLLCIHGTGSNYYGSTLFNGLTTALRESGLRIWRVNTRGHDMIATSAGILHGSAYELVADCLLDLRAWVNLLTERGFQRIGLVGHSLGAMKGIFALALKAFPEITRLIAISPPWLSHARFSAGRKRELFLATLAEAQRHVDAGQGQTLMEVAFPLPYVVTASGYLDKYGPEERYSVPKLIGDVKTPTLVTFGTEELGDGGAFHGLPEELERLAAAGESAAEVRVIAGANHQYLGCHAELAGQVLRWLRANA